MVQDLLADRAEQQPGEPAAAPRPDDDQVGVGAFVQQRCRGMLLGGFYTDRDPLGERGPGFIHGAEQPFAGPSDLLLPVDCHVGLQHGERVDGGVRRLPRVYSDEFGAQPFRFDQREPQRGSGMLGAVHAHDDTAAAGRGLLAGRRHHHDRAGGVGGDTLRYRAEEERRDPAVPAGADDEQFRVLRGFQQGVVGFGPGHFGDGPQAGCGLLDAPQRFFKERFCCLRDFRGRGGADRSSQRDGDERQPHRIHQAQRGPAPRGSVNRPVQGVQAAFRAVHSDHDRARHGFSVRHALSFPGRRLAFSTRLLRGGSGPGRPRVSRRDNGGRASSTLLCVTPGAGPVRPGRRGSRESSPGPVRSAGLPHRGGDCFLQSAAQAG